MSFCPCPFEPQFRNPHLETIAAHYWPRPDAEAAFPTERCFVGTEPDVEVLVESQRPEATAGDIVLVHGLEGSSDAGCCRVASGGHVATIVAGPGARPGARLTTPTDHYSLLQTIEDVFGLRRLRNAACACTRSLKPLLASAGTPGAASG